jgi:hypothetical protein
LLGEYGEGNTLCRDNTRAFKLACFSLLGRKEEVYDHPMMVYEKKRASILIVFSE